LARSQLPSPHIMFLAVRLNRDKPPDVMRRRVPPTAVAPSGVAHAFHTAGANGERGWPAIVVLS